MSSFKCYDTYREKDLLKWWLSSSFFFLLSESTSDLVIQQLAPFRFEIRSGFPKLRLGMSSSCQWYSQPPLHTNCSMIIKAIELIRYLFDRLQLNSHHRFEYPSPYFLSFSRKMVLKKEKGNEKKKKRTVHLSSK